jgi:uncharacterized protein YbaP (TraB family)
MKKLLIGLLAATGLSTPACATEGGGSAANATAAGQPAASTAVTARLPDADPAMWVVRDKDTTIYLFGTFHALDGKSDWFNDEVKEAFDRSQELVLEADMPDDPAKVQAAMQPLIMRYAVDQSGRKLSERLTSEQNKAFNAALATLGAPPGAFDMFEPWFATVALAGVAVKKLGLTEEAGAETVLKRAAKARSMRLGAVETMEGQIQMFDSMPEEQQLNQLRETLDDMDAMHQTLPRMVTVWNSGDAAGMDAIMNEGLQKYPELRRIMLGDRNEKWAEWIKQRMDQPGTVFMAVGAGHLVGHDSVQTFLQRHGIQSERVPSQTPNR